MRPNPKKFHASKTISIPSERKFSQNLPKKFSKLSDLDEELNDNANLDHILETNLENNPSDRGVTTGSVTNGKSQYGSLSNSKTVTQDEQKVEIDNELLALQTLDHGFHNTSKLED